MSNSLGCRNVLKREKQEGKRRGQHMKTGTDIAKKKEL